MAAVFVMTGIAHAAVVFVVLLLVYVLTVLQDNVDARAVNLLAETAAPVALLDKLAAMALVAVREKLAAITRVLALRAPLNIPKI